MSTSNPTSPLGPLGHLHYGGSFNTKSGNVGSRPRAKKTFRTQRRFELMVRLENAQIPAAAAATMLGISLPRLNQIKRLPDYLIARMKITHGIIVDHDASLSQVKEQRKEMLTQMLPAALQIIKNQIENISGGSTLAERKHQAALAQDLLDREGTFAKVSRTELKPVDHFDFESADAASRSIIHAIRTIAPPSEAATHSAKAVAANNEFSNSHTLSAVDQQAALDALEAEAALLADTPTQTDSIN